MLNIKSVTRRRDRDNVLDDLLKGIKIMKDTMT